MTQLSRSLRIAILERDGYRCVYCGRSSADSLLEVDHVTPRSVGGLDDPENLVVACQSCNRGKLANPVALPSHVTTHRPLPGWYIHRQLNPKPLGKALSPILRARVAQEGPTDPRSIRERVWPVSEGIRPGATVNRRGWPLPDGSWDQWCVKPHFDGFLPWGVWQTRHDWWVGFYTCDQGHAWTCGHSGTAGWSEIYTFRVSPVERLPDRGYLKVHLPSAFDPAAVRRVDYPGRSAPVQWQPQ